MSEFFEITVHGRPATQGSKTRNRWGGVRDDNAETLHPWREAVRHTAVEVIAKARQEGIVVTPMDGPVVLEVAFALPKPKSAPKRRRTWPIGARAGDLDKLVRAICDALTDAGVWGDDSQVAVLTSSKAYEGDPGVPDVPGAFIRVHKLAEAVA